MFKDFVLKNRIDLEKSNPLTWSSKKRTFQVGLLLLLFFSFYAGVFYDLVTIWWTRDDYMHGFLIIPISLYLVWLKRQRLERLTPAPAFWSGLIVILAAAGLHLLGEAGEIMVFGGISLIGMMIGLVLLLLGRPYLKFLLFPILYLFFMVPILDELIAPLHWPFQILTADMGVAMLQRLGFSALREQQYIVLPNITLEVARVCSGASYLISIVAIGLPLATMVLRRWWSRMTLIISAIIIGVVANWVRVVFIGIWAYWGGEIHGPLHIFQGMFVAWIGFIALFTGAWALSKVDRAALRHRNSAFSLAANPEVGQLSSSSRWERSWGAGVFVFVFCGTFLFVNERKPVPLQTNLEAFPMVIGEWRGEPVALQEAIFRVNNADHELFRVYQDRDGYPMRVYIAYLETQYQGKEIVNYKTTILHKNAQEISAQIYPQRRMPVNVGFFEEQQGRQRILFWYQINGHVLANPYRAKLLGTVDTLLRGRTNGAFILISEDPSHEDRAGFWEKEVIFLRALDPIVRQYLP